MEVVFGSVSRKVAPQSDVDEFWATIVRMIPGLAPHRDGLEMRYVDDEGDEIMVTTTDELQEAIRVGKEMGDSTLNLRLSVPGIDGRTQIAIEATAVSENPVPPPRGVIAAAAAPTSTTTDILQVLKQAGTSAVAELNSAMGIAAKEIDVLFCQLGTASTKQKKTEKQLVAAKAALVEANSRCTAGEQQVSSLKENLSAAETLLEESRAQKARDAARLQALEVQAAEAVEWEKKWKIAEEQRLRLEQQLQALQSGLRRLSVGEPEATSAEVVSTEVVPPSPVIEPVPAAELPPPYTEAIERPVGVPVANHNVFPVDTVDTTAAPIAATAVKVIRRRATAVKVTPVANQFPADCPAPTPLQLKMQQLRAMGFQLTYEQLREKLVEHSGNMQHVINSLL